MEKNYGSHIDFPSNWKVERLKDNFSIYPTASYSRADLTEDGPVKYIHYGDIHTQFDFHLDVQKNNLPRITEEQIKKYQLVEEGDLVIADASEDYEGVGKAVEVINVNNEKVIAGLHTFLIRDNAKVFAPKFKGYALLSSYVREQMYRLATGTKVYSISKESLKDIKIPLPPIEEQNAIANCLSTWDEAIEKQQKLIEAKEIRHKALMQKLLSGKKRLPGFTDEWKEVKLGDVCVFKNGKAHESIIDDSGDYILINSKFISTNGKVQKRVSKDLSPLKLNDLVFVMSDVPNGKALAKFFYVSQDNLYSLNQRIGLLRVKNGISKFYFYFLNRNRYFLEFDNGVGQTNLKKDDILDCPLLIPTIKEQEAIAYLIETSDSEIKLEQGILDQLREQKKALMQKLLTGKVRLPLQN